MTIALSDNTPRISYSVSQGVTQTSFAVPFVFFDGSTDINVFVDNVARTYSPTTSNTTLFTVSGGNGSTGTVTTTVTGATGGSTVVITREVPLARTTDFPSSGAFEIAKLNTELDTLTAIQSDFNDDASRALRLQESDDAVSMELPLKADRLGKVLGFNATTGAAEAGPTIADVSSLSAITADISTLADIEDGTDATDAIQTVASISSNVTTVAGISANVTTVASISSDVTAVVADQADIGTVATNISSVNTVATNIADVITVANDLNEAVSEVVTVADDLNEAVSEIDTVAGSISNVDAVGTNISNVNTVAGISANVTTVAGVSANVTTVAGISSNVTTVAGISSDVTAVAGDATDIGTVATNIANVNTVAGNNSNVTTVAGISANVTTVAGISSDVTAVVADQADIGTVATDLSGSNNIGTVAGSISNVNNVAGSITNVNTVATNIASVNSFSEVYRIESSAPTTSLDIGDLYFDTTSDTLKVYGSGGWQAAGSSVNGTSQRYHYDITGTPTSVTGADANGNTLTYDAGYVDVYVNGVRMSTADVTVTSGDTVTFTEALADGDEVDIVGYGTFSVASLNADNLDSGTVPDARITGAYTGITNLTMSGDLTVDTNTLYVDSANNRVGVGTVSPAKPLHIFNSGTSYVQISGNSRDLFLGQDATGGAVFSTGAVPLYFSTDSTERMRIDSNGNFMVSTTENTLYNDTSGSGLCYRPNLSLDIARESTSASSYMFSLNNTGVDAKFINFAKDGSGVGSIGANGGQPYFINSSNKGIRPYTSGVAAAGSAGAFDDAAQDLGASSVRWRDLYLSGGVYLGGTGSANKLDEYEEGTWNPVVSTSSGSAGTATFAQAIYTKIGRMVFIHCHCNNIDKTGTTSTAQFRITGLPFTIDVGSTAGSAIGDNITFEGSRTQLMTLFDTNEYILFRQIGTGVGDATLDYAQLSSAGYSDIFISGFYYTNQ